MGVTRPSFKPAHSCSRGRYFRSCLGCRIDLTPRVIAQVHAVARWKRGSPVPAYWVVRTVPGCSGRARHSAREYGLGGVPGTFDENTPGWYESHVQVTEYGVSAQHAVNRILNGYQGQQRPLIRRQHKDRGPNDQRYWKLLRDGRSRGRHQRSRAGATGSHRLVVKGNDRELRNRNACQHCNISRSGF